MTFKDLLQYAGIEFSPASHLEKIISGLGACLAIYVIYSLSYQLLGAASFFIVASMGASAVLLFAVPHGPLSQPWPLFAGHLFSACMGVACSQWIGDIAIAAAVAVGLSVSGMYYLKCIHPPGGATALAAVVSGSAVSDLGFTYVLMPVFLNVLIIFSVAVIFNFAFKWRRYPALLSVASEKEDTSPHAHHQFSHQAIAHALRQIDSFVDVSEEDLARIYGLAKDFDRQTNKQKTAR